MPQAGYGVPACALLPPKALTVANPAATKRRSKRPPLLLCKSGAHRVSKFSKQLTAALAALDYFPLRGALLVAERRQQAA
jgi:hypothetical protein